MSATLLFDTEIGIAIPPEDTTDWRAGLGQGQDARSASSRRLARPCSRIAMPASRRTEHGLRQAERCSSVPIDGGSASTRLHRRCRPWQGRQSEVGGAYQISSGRSRLVFDRCESRAADAPCDARHFGSKRRGGAAALDAHSSAPISSGCAAALCGRSARLLEPLLSGTERRRLATMARIAEECARLGTPALRGLPIADAHEIAVRPRRGLIDAADAGRQAAAFGGAWH